ncbi:MAG: hypothetical protein IT457_15765 [Planctomycetes bacterium]|nr:hypothetical protein [Planctomycetota bacterium]
MVVQFSQDLLADPLGFLASSAPNMTGAVGLDPGVVGTFTARPTPNFKIRYRTGARLLGRGNAKADGRSFELRWKRPADGGDLGEVEEFNAYWSGYAGGLATHCDLPGGGAAALMLTPRVDGCTLTFVLGPGGAARFGHYNLKAGNATLGGAAMAEAAEANHPGQNPAVFSKEYYYSKAKRSVSPELGKRTMVNAFGVRQGGAWRFFVQYLESKDDGYQIRGVEELVAGARYIAAGV